MNEQRKTAIAAPNYKQYDIVASIALRAKHQKSGLQFIADLQNQRAADKVAANLTAYAVEVSELERERDELKATAEALQAHADKMTTPAEEARAAARKAAKARKAANALTARIKQLEPLFSMTLSDRFDIVQTAALEAQRRIIDPANIPDPDKAIEAAEEHLEALKAEAAAVDDAAALAYLEALTPEELAQETANYKATITAAGKAISAHAAPEALNRYTTKATRATPEEVAEWIAKYGGTGADIKHHTPIKRTRASECWETMEYKQYKSKPSGFYHIIHYRTVSPYVSYEAFQEATGGDNSEVVKNYGINAIETQAAAEALDEVIAAANLTERERLFCRYILDNTAAKHGEQAVSEYYAEKAAKNQKPSKAAAENARWTGQRDNAFSRIGLTSKESRKKFLQRIRKAFQDPESKRRNATKAADNVSKYPTTPEAWKALMTSRIRGQAVQDSRPDLVQAYSRHAATIPNPAPVINWTESGATAEATAPGVDYRAADVLSRDSYRKTAPKAKKPYMTIREAAEAAKREIRLRETAELIEAIERLEAVRSRTEAADKARAATAKAEREKHNAIIRTLPMAERAAYVRQLAETYKAKK